MKTPSGDSVSIWMAETPPLRRSPLRSDLAVEVCVVGAGIAGLTAAYRLLRDGKKVVVLEGATIGSGQTGRTTAHFVTALDDRYFELEKFHGTDGARLAAWSHAAAIELAEEIVTNERIDCDWRRIPGYLFLSPGDDADLLRKELAAAHRAGLSEVELLSRAPLSAFDTGECLKFPRQATFSPMRYLEGLTRAIERMGGQIFTDTLVEKIEAGFPATVTTADCFRVKAESLLVATNSPINDFVAVHLKQAPYRTFSIAATVPKGSVEAALYWDTGDPYHYLRVEESHPAHDFLIIGGEDHKTGQGEAHERAFERLVDWSRSRFPMIQEITHRWSGQCMEPVDGLGYIGRNPGDGENIYIITGDSGNGMTHCTFGASLVADLIAGRSNPWEELYSPTRIRWRATPAFVRENANSVAQYVDWIKPTRTGSPEGLLPGEGAIFHDGVRTVAVFRAEDGVLHRSSAACPHMGAVVHWNETEKTWDCPCHGSRFDGEGRVINGPALADLTELAPEPEPRGKRRAQETELRV